MEVQVQPYLFFEGRCEEAIEFYRKSLDAKVDVIMGDARLTMEREIAENRSQQFDLLALDAFSSDAIPVHLLTREAFALYKSRLGQHLRPATVAAPPPVVQCPPIKYVGQGSAIER